MANLLENDDLREIGELLRNKPDDVIFFVGAGISKRSGFPLWHELLFDLISYGKRIQRLSTQDVANAKLQVKKGEYLLCGDLIRERLGARVDRFLTETFCDKPQHPNSSSYLARLPCAGFVTTNYDTLLEDGYADFFHRSLDPTLATDDSLATMISKRPFLLKLHGDCRRGHYVLSARDYTNLEHLQPLSRFLYSLFLHRKAVFLGYGLSDRDILRPLELLTSDWPRSVYRHVAILPFPAADAVRWELEEKRNVNVVGYDPSDGHEEVQQVILRWFSSIALGDRPVPALLPPDYAELLKNDPDPLVSRLKARVYIGWQWACSQKVLWGPHPDAPPKAANIAEGLIAAKAARRVLRAKFETSALVTELLAFRRGGAFVSSTIDSVNVQTHAVSMFALASYQDTGDEVVSALEEGADWLLDAIGSSGQGWGRFAGSSEVRVIPTIWAFAALHRADRFPSDTWQQFCELLLSQQTIGFVVGSSAPSTTAAGWLLWLLGLLNITGTRETELVRVAARQLAAVDNLLANETEFFQLDASRGGIRLSWLHSSAPAVLLGLLPWVERVSTLWATLGICLKSLLIHSAASPDGHFKDATSERGPTDPLIPHTMYSVWALCECVQQFGGIVFEKSGFFVIRNRKVLLVRKRGTRELIAVGGTLKPDESPELALEREVAEELGVGIIHPTYWRTFIDAAAFEPGAKVRIRAYLGEFSGSPNPLSEIAELVWADSSTLPDELSPIIRNYILPALSDEGLID